MSIWFSSDHHFGHEKIIKYCGRPFATVEAMDAVLVERWNARVKPEDIVYYLGDFAFKSNLREVAALRARLQGVIVLIKGNHDQHSNAAFRRAGFAEVYRSLVVPVQTASQLFLSHRPPWQLRDNKPVFHPGEGWRVCSASLFESESHDIDVTGPFLCGHVHEKWAQGRVDAEFQSVLEGGTPVINVGVDVRGFAPASLEELLANPPGTVIGFGDHQQPGIYVD